MILEVLIAFEVQDVLGDIVEWVFLYYKML